MRSKPRLNKDFTESKPNPAKSFLLVILLFTLPFFTTTDNISEVKHEQHSASTFFFLFCCCIKLSLTNEDKNEGFVSLLPFFFTASFLQASKPNQQHYRPRFPQLSYHKNLYSNNSTWSYSVDLFETHFSRVKCDVNSWNEVENLSLGIMFISWMSLWINQFVYEPVQTPKAILTRGASGEWMSRGWWERGADNSREEV